MDCMTCSKPTMMVYNVNRAGKRWKVCHPCSKAFGNPMYEPPKAPSVAAQRDAANRADDAWYESLDEKRKAGWRRTGYTPAIERKD